VNTSENKSNPSVDSAVDYAISQSSSLNLSFEKAAWYNYELGHTFRRTVEDVAGLGSGLRILEVGSFTGVVSVALQRLGHQVTASDIHFVLEDKALR
jgi:2-polyprenyl-3-methyl-5-hydroxy-6-metoxy-1,4-benzoquinol methylase